MGLFSQTAAAKTQKAPMKINLSIVSRIFLKFEILLSLKANPSDLSSERQSRVSTSRWDHLLPKIIYYPLCYQLVYYPLFAIRFFAISFLTILHFTIRLFSTSSFTIRPGSFSQDYVLIFLICLIAQIGNFVSRKNFEMKSIFAELTDDLSGTF